VRSKALWRLLAVVLALALVGAACSDDDDDEAAPPAGQEDENGQAEDSGETLQRVRDRGELKCGVNDQVPGFGFTDEQGAFSGFDIDYCRAVAAAVLGDPEAVDFVVLTAEERFTALQGGDIDVLIRNTTWTASRDGGEGATFATTTFYDAQGMLVKADAGISSLEDLEGASICVLKGTTTELNLATVFGAQGISHTPLSLETNEDIQPRFIADECEGWTSDKSQLAAIRSAWPETEGGPEALTILEEAMSKEPLGPVTRDGDSEWSHIVDWVVIATIQAEEFGITQANVEGFESEDPNVLRFLGKPVPPDNEVFESGLGLEADFAIDVIKAVGNYGEIYDRNVGAGSPLELDRLQNNLWTEGGLLYAPPYR